MSLIRIIVTDAETILTGEIHGSEADKIVASLAAEPENIEELEIANRRYLESETNWSNARWFSRIDLAEPGDFSSFLDLQPYDAGLVVVDLLGKTILVDSTYSDPAPTGQIFIQDKLSDENGQSFPLYYELSKDWFVIRETECFVGKAKERREEQSKHEKQDFRQVLYGKEMIGFFVEAVSDLELPLSSKQIEEMHSEWLMKRRPDLQGRSPREIIIEKQHFIDMDLQSRSLQHSFAKEIPPPIEKTTSAYIYGGFGTHETVCYYDAIRDLISYLDTKFEGMKEINIIEETELGKSWFDEWYAKPREDYSNRTPAKIVDLERTRSNIVMMPSEAIIDEDCPICQAMAEDFDTPGFWHLDAAHFDEGFAFSSFETYEEWEKEQKEREEWMKDAILGKKRSEYEATDPDTFIKVMRGELPD